MIVADDFIAGTEAVGSKWSCALSPFYRLELSATGRINGSSGAVIVLADNLTLVCRHHRNGPDVTGAYWCEHLEFLNRNKPLDAEMFQNMTQAICAPFFLQLRIIEDIFTEVQFYRVNDDIFSVHVSGHDENSIGLVMPEHEGLSVIREMVINYYSEWTTASPTMCTSTQHWRARGLSFGLKDKICLDAEKMCYPCAARASQAMKKVDAPDDQGGGFASLPASTPKKVPPGTPVFTTPDGKLSPFAGGGPTTVGSTRSSDGAVWDGNVWVSHGGRTDPEVEIPFNFAASFASTLDEKTWHEFYGALEAKDKS